MSTVSRLLGVALLTLATTACTTSSPRLAEPSDLERTWAQATVVLPPLGASAPLRTTMNSPQMAARLRLLPAGSKAPVVVYAHGCTGLDNFAFLERIAQAGFVVVAPNSFARRYRPLQCDPVTQTGGRNLFVYDFRLAEIAFALDKLWLRQWVDWERMLLVGTSEGGVAAALYRGNEFQGRVITQWTCAGAPHVAGIAAPLSEPILAVRSSVDPWYGPENAGDCQDSFGQRLNSRSYVVEGPVGHNVLSEPAVVELIAEFLVLRATGRGR